MHVTRLLCAVPPHSATAIHPLPAARFPLHPSCIAAHTRLRVTLCCTTPIGVTSSPAFFTCYPLQPPETRYRSFRVRFVSSIVLIVSFLTLIWAGHVPLMFMVLGIQVGISCCTAVLRSAPCWLGTLAVVAAAVLGGR